MMKTHSSKHLSRLLVAGGLALASAGSLSAATYNWIGFGSDTAPSGGDGVNLFGPGLDGVSGYVNNWSPVLVDGSFPVAGDFVINGDGLLLNERFYLAADQTIRSLRFEGAFPSTVYVDASDGSTTGTRTLSFGTSGATLLAVATSSPTTVVFGTSTGINLNYSGFGTIDVSSGNSLNLFNTAIAGAGGLIKTGAGTLTLGSGNSFSGKIQINGGTVAITGAAQLGASPAAVTADAVTINGGTLAYSGTSTVASSTNRGFTIGANGGTIDTASGSELTINGVIAGSSVLNKTGDGILTYGTVNTFTGTTYISGGTLSSAGFSRLGGTGATIVLDGGTLRLTYLSTTVTVTTVSAAATRSFQVGDGVGTFEVVNSTSTSAITTRTLKGAITNYNGEVGILRKTGNGILALQGGATHTGGTQLNAGTLLLVNSTLGGEGGAGLTVASGATFDGAGTINGNSSFLDGSIIKVGVYTDTGNSLGQSLTNVFGTYNFTGNLDISGAAASATASFNFDLGASGVSDLISLSSGVLTIGNGQLGLSDFVFTTQTGFDTGSYTLFSSTQSVVGSLLSSDVTGVVNGHSATLGISSDGMSVILTIGASAVPEPGTWAAIAGAGAFAFVVVRRVRRRDSAV